MRRLRMSDEVIVTQAIDEKEENQYTQTAYQLLADRLCATLIAIAGEIPGRVAAHPTTRPFEMAHRTVPDEFIASMTYVVDDTEEVDKSGVFDSGGARDMLQFNAAFTTFADQLEAVLNSLRFTMGMKKAVHASSALRAYAILKALARGRPDIRIRIAPLTRDLHRKGRKKKSADE